jgi:glucose/arabinose dehydrogenase
MKTILSYSFLLFAVVALSQTTNSIGISSFATGLSKPVEIAHAKDNRLFLVEQSGKIKIINPSGTVKATPFLDVSALTNYSPNTELGLLGLAFHPNYKTNGIFFINYTNTSGNTVIAKYTVSTADSNIANTSGTIVLTINQPFNNHNGGTIKFGADGYLYIGMGDGGSAGDPGNRAQNMNLLLGKMLRIDIDTAVAYKIPSTNPYIGVAGADEIWASGLRNPWKFSFDRLNNDLWIADVGQDDWEEISKATSTQAGLNYGWRCYEANVPYNTSGCNAASSYHPALVSLDHDSNFCSITGGYVYRGTNYPSFYGKYLFSDLCKSKIGLVDATGNVTYSSNFSGKAFTSFGEDFSGEHYVADYGVGTIFKIIDNSLSIDALSNSDFKIYPNPANSFLFIESPEASFPMTVSIIDLNGAICSEVRLVDTSKNKIDFSNLASGTYMLKIIEKNERSVFRKLVIQ